MTVSPDWLHYQAEVHKDRTALVTSEGRWSFQQLDSDTAHVAAILKGLGVAAGDRVAYHFTPSRHQVLIVHALTRLKAVLVPLNTRLTEPELDRILIDADPHFIIHDTDRQKWPLNLTALKVDQITALHSQDTIAPRELAFDDLHALIYTSGTTGHPKGVELTVGNQWWSAQGFALQAGLFPNDRWLNVMPLFHVGGLTILFRSVIHGSTVFLESRFNAQSAHTLMEQEDITLLSVVPTMLHRLLELGRPAPASLRLVLLGGAPATQALIHKARREGYPVVATYGMTETSSQVVTQDIHDEGPSSGHANLPTQIRIVSDGRDCPSDQLGEIWIKGPTVARGYWRQPKETQSVFLDGWLKTGDLGVLDEWGLLTVTDRIKDTIIRGGENIYPREVENLLLNIPGVTDAAVFGYPDTHWGEVVACMIVADTKLSRRDIQSFLSNKLASYKIPSMYFRADTIPRNPAGKVLRRQLASQAEALTEWVD